MALDLRDPQRYATHEIQHTLFPSLTIETLPAAEFAMSGRPTPIATDMLLRNLSLLSTPTFTIEPTQTPIDVLDTKTSAQNKTPKKDIDISESENFDDNMMERKKMQQH